MQSLMQKTAAQRASVARTASRPARASRVAVRAVAEQSRREVFGGLLAGVASLVLAESANAAAAGIDLFDDRKVKSTGYDAIYEAREAELPQAVRAGFSQARADLAGTKSRVKESEKRIDSDLAAAIQKSYWTDAREQLRRQVGTLRFDINALAETKPKADKKAALNLKKEFLAKVDSLDFAIRQKNKDSALAALAATQSSLDAVLAAVL